MVSKSKDCLGKRSLARSDTSGPNRKQFVGLMPVDPNVVLPEGAAILNTETQASIAPLQGHVTSSYMSPILGRSIALALLRDGQNRTDDPVYVSMPGGGFAQARVCSPVFYDPEGTRQNVE